MLNETSSSLLVSIFLLDNKSFIISMLSFITARWSAVLLKKENLKFHLNKGFWISFKKCDLQTTLKFEI